MKSLRIVVAVVCLSVSLLALGEAPGLEFGGGPPTIRGFAVGTKVAWMAVVRERGGGVNRMTVLRGLEPVTPRGDLAVDRNDRDYSRSIWLIAALDEPIVVQTSSPDYPLTPVPVQVRARVGETSITVQSGSIHMAWVRRNGELMWTFAGADGGSLDADGVQNGSMVISVASMWAFRGSPAPPSALAAGDLLLLIDPDDNRVAAVEVVE